MDAISYHATATGPFAPLYPYYAEQVIAKSGIRAGVCLDAGCGGGYLGLAVAERTGMDLILLDQSEEMLAIACTNSAAQAVRGWVELIHAPVQAIPLADEAVNLVVSRGSIPFWEELPRALLEIYRVLRPGGFAFLGGGLGTPEMRAAIVSQMKDRGPEWSKEGSNNIPRHPVSHYADALEAAKIPGATVSRGEDGTWIEFRK